MSSVENPQGSDGQGFVSPGYGGSEPAGIPKFPDNASDLGGAIHDLVHGGQDRTTYGSEYDHLFNGDDPQAEVAVVAPSPAYPVAKRGHYTSEGERQGAIREAGEDNMLAARRHIEDGGTDFRSAPPEVVAKLLAYEPTERQLGK